MNFLRRIYPFNLEQTVNVLSEFGPLMTLFVVQKFCGPTIGIWSLIGTTLLALVVMRVVLNKLPILAIIAGGVTLLFSVIALRTEDPGWIQIKVTLFNLVFAGVLTGGLLTKRNVFKHTFETTFHYTDEGWSRFTTAMIGLFVFLAIANEVIRQTFWHTNQYEFWGWHGTGFDLWALFKLAIVMPGSGIYTYFVTRPMRQYAIPPEDTGAAAATEAAVEISMIP